MLISDSHTTVDQVRSSKHEICWQKKHFVVRVFYMCGKIPSNGCGSILHTPKGHPFIVSKIAYNVLKTNPGIKIKDIMIIIALPTVKMWQ